jgi:hypothetical protein
LSIGGAELVLTRSSPSIRWEIFMNSSHRTAIKTAGMIAGLSLGLCSSLAFAQAPPARGGGFAADPRAQSRTYTFAEAGQDMPYCVYASSKVAKDKPAPLIVSLHGMGAPPTIMCNKDAIDLAEQGGYVLVAPMGYNTTGWFGSPVISMGGRGPRGAGAPGGIGHGPIITTSQKDIYAFFAKHRKK